MAEKRTNEEVLDLFADLLEPSATILGDKEILNSLTRGDPRVKTAALAIKRHKPEVIQILALLDGVPVDDYKVSLISLPIKLVRLLNQPEFSDLFTGADQKRDAVLSGSATENIGGGVN